MEPYIVNIYPGLATQSNVRRPEETWERSFSRKCPGAPKVLWQEKPAAQARKPKLHTGHLQFPSLPSLYISHNPTSITRNPEAWTRKPWTLLTAGTPNCMRKLLKPCPCYPVPSALSCLPCPEILQIAFAQISERPMPYVRHATPNL